MHPGRSHFCHQESAMKFVIHPSKPRNPMVVPARFRAAGSHRPRTRMQRQNERRSLLQELEAMKRPRP
jgi:hypothetical protein